jgi:hypothetical protein
LAVDPAIARANRRIELIALGRAAGESSLFPGKTVRRPNPKILRQVKKIARREGFDADRIQAYESDAGRLLRAAGQRKSREQLFVCVKTQGELGRLTSGRRTTLPKTQVLVIRAGPDGVFDLRTYVSR